MVDGTLLSRTRLNHALPGGRRRRAPALPANGAQNGQGQARQDDQRRHPQQPPAPSGGPLP
ncbi:hypothetical protein [Streptomyces niveus]|uniref:hypothetical protein n=1 Tax=Streptomyces niveus TaxID=193462 RepID=UPI0036BB3AD1